ncbi:unnamed protein product [Aphis gossypii]|uniref:Sterile alpha and TIR motif-containing protein 1-like n=1 Tax=Aphis gossypii TaxID=80765 RepID=A0A9P0NG28_APHGO|nr:unnamed protein product [Aphis gossypii]
MHVMDTMCRYQKNKISNVLCKIFRQSIEKNNHKSNSEELSEATEEEITKQLGTASMIKINSFKSSYNVFIYSNDTVSKLALQPCQLIYREVAYSLNSKVPQWSIEDVLEWFKQIGFSEFDNNLLENLVDGDLLLRLTEDELRDDIGINNSITKKRIMRELNNLKQSADYSCIDSTGLNSFLKSINPEFSIYTYSMLIAGINTDTIRFITEDQLQNVCGISNDTHRHCIINSIKKMPAYVENMDKPYDAFISYKRSTSSVLASLLKVYLEIRGYKVFIDVKRSNDAKYQNNVLQIVKQSKNFITVLTPNSFDTHLMVSLDEDIEILDNDMIRKEITIAEQSQCNIIPVLNNFSWSSFAQLPDDLKNLNAYNSISWVHEYQDACVNKLVKFMIK